MTRVMVVDDDVTVREVVVTYLRAAGHEVDETADGEGALALLRDHPADLVVLDLMLPGIDGLEVCERLRARGDDLPVIMLTALGSETDRVVGLERGADDYVTKPFSPRELVLRVDSVLRRAGERAGGGVRGAVEDGDLVVDSTEHTATLGGRRLSLTAREFDLLRFFLSHPGQAFSRDELLQKVWGWSFGDQSTVTVHVRRLREKVEADPTHPVRLVDRLGRRVPLGAHGMTHDQLTIIWTTAAWSGGVAVVGGVLIWLARRASVRWLTVGVAVVAVLAVLAGTLATARAMFLSQHDLGVVVLVATVAGIVALLFALAVGTALARWSRGLQEQTRVFGDSGEFVGTASAGPAEFEQLSVELRRTSAKLAESRDREIALEQSRRELVSWVSHDLRTPLAGLRAMTEALEDGLADDPARYHAQMRAEVERMVRMVDDLFELSRIHAGVMRLSPQPVALGDVVSEALASADSVARARGVRLGGEVDQDVLVTADPSGLSRVVSNLLMNAIRHTPADGVVEVHGRAVVDGVELSVTDGCGGLSEDDMARVFDVAWQGSTARTPDHADVSAGAGAGLGLAIVKGIVEAHLGRVVVANHEPGCRFLVHLPA